MKKLLKSLAFVFAAVAAIVVILSIPKAKAAGSVSVTTEGIALGDIPAENIKLNGRVKWKNKSLEGGYSGTGFTLNVTAPAATTFTVTLSTNYSGKISIFVDGDESQLATSFAAKDGYTQSVSLAKGDHVVQVVKESQIGGGKTSYFRYDSVAFNGTINERPADKDTYVEIIGDSITCGDGAVGVYNPGVKWSEPRDDAASRSYAWYLGKMLDADVSLVSKGGIGLNGSDAQQETDTDTITSDMVYEYATYADYYNGVKYDFTTERTPDLIVIALCANDGNKAANEATWAAIAKSFIQKIKAIRGDVPILWLTEHGHSRAYRSLHEMFKSDPDLSVYDNLYTEYTYLMRNGSAALATQTGGHPDAQDQYALAERVYQMITTREILHREPVYENEKVYYVSENGSDSNNGLTEATPLLTVTKALSKFPATKNANGLVGHIYVTGNVVSATTQSFGNVAEPKLHSDGTPVQFIIETLNYDSATDNRATLTDNYVPGKSGQLVCALSAPFVLKNVKFYCAKYMKDSTTSAITKIFAAGNKSVFDNVTFENIAGTKFILDASDYTYHSYMKDSIDGDTPMEGCIELRNGTYDATRGLSVITCTNQSSIWASDANGGSRKEAKGYTARVVVGYGATVPNSMIYAVTSSLKLKECIVEVAGGGTITGGYTGTKDGKSTATNNISNGCLTLKVSGGLITGGPVAAVGNYCSVTGDLHFEMTGGEVYVPGGTSNATSGAFLTGSKDALTITGNTVTNISGGVFYMAEGSTSYDKNVVFGGYNNTVSGTQTNTITGGAFFFTGDMKSTSSVYANTTSNIKGGITNYIYGGLFDNYLGSKSNYSFGGQALKNVFSSIKTVVGEDTGDGRNVGPVFINSGVNLAGGWGQVNCGTYSATPAAEDQAASDEVVEEVIINGGKFEGNVNTTTASAVNVSSKYYSRVLGSTRTIINNGCFEGNVNLTNASPIYGHAYAEINGGFFTDLTGIASTSTSGLIKDGLEVVIHDYFDFQKVKTQSYTFKMFNTGTISAVTAGRPAVSLTIDKGTFSKINLNKNSEVIDGDFVVNVTTCMADSVTSDTAKGFLKDGYFVTAPEEDLVATGYAITDSTSYAGYPYQVGKAHLNHCVCGTGFADGIGTHVCDDSVVWTDLNAFYAAHKSEITSSTLMGAVIPSGYYYLSGDLKLPYQWFVSTDDTVPGSGPRDYYICLNGHSLKAANKSRVFCFNCGTTDNPCGLHVCDCSEAQNGTIDGSSTTTAGGAILANNYPFTFDMFGGTLIGGKAKSNGGNLCFYAKGTLNMYGGAFKNGGHTTESSSGLGGNIYTTGTINMYGGEISGGTSITNGGNIYLATTGVLNQYGGVIKDGDATSIAGNVFVDGGCTYNMYGGSMEDGIGNYGGNIRVNGTFIMDGEDALVTGGYCRQTLKDGKMDGGHGGNMYIGAGTFKLKNGTISNGYSEASKGANISMNNSKSVFEMTGGVITGGSGSKYSVSIWNNTAATAKISGGIIKDCDYAIELQKGTLEITGGYFESPIYLSSTENTKSITGTPYFADRLPVDFIDATHDMITLNPTVQDTFGNVYYYSYGEGATVYTTSATTVGTGDSIAPVTGGGFIRKTDDLTLSAPEEYNGYHFVNWKHENGDLVSEDATCTVAAADVKGGTYTAYYAFGKKNVTLNVEGNAFTVKETDGSANASDTIAKSYTFAPGTKVSVTFDVSDENFEAWTNDSGKYVSTEVTYEFNIYIDTTLIALSRKDVMTDTTDVAFVNIFKQVQKKMNLTAAGITATDVPAQTKRLGRKFDHYDVELLNEAGSDMETADTIDALVSLINEKNGAYELITVTEVYVFDEDADVYSVTVQNVLVLKTEDVLNLDKWNMTPDIDSYETRVGVLTLMTARDYSEDGYRFLAYVRKPNKATAEIYALSETAYMNADQDKEETLYAVYTKDTAELTEKVSVSVSNMTMMDQGDGRYTVSTTVVSAVPENYTVVERGVLFTYDALLTNSGKEANLRSAKEVLNYETANKYKSVATEAMKAATLNIKNVPASTMGDNVFYTCGYIIYIDDKGVQGIELSGVSYGAINDGKFVVSPKKNVLDGKRIMFIGNSYIYYGQTTEYISATNHSMEDRTGDNGYFARMAQTNGANPEVVNWIWGSHLGIDFFGDTPCVRKDYCIEDNVNHYQNLISQDYDVDYVVFQDCGREGLSGYEEWMDYCETCAETFRSANPNVELYYLINQACYGYNVFNNGAVLSDVLDRTDELEELGFHIVNWGLPATNLANGVDTLPGSTHTYEPWTFIVAKDGGHENLLSGYVTTLMLYCSITGEKPEWQEHSFVFDNQPKIGRLYSIEQFEELYYEGTDSNSDEIFADDAEMDRLRAYISNFIGRNK